MSKFEKTGGADGIPEDMPLKGTMEMLGVKPEVGEKGEKGRAEAPESYRDIGERRLAAAAERVRGLGGKTGSFMGRAWEKVKSIGSKVKEVGKSTLVYTLAAPEMARDAHAAAREGVAAGTEYVAAKGKAAYEGAKDIGSAAASRAFEGMVTVYDKSAEGVVYVSDRAKAAYEGAVNFGKEKMAKLRERAEDARGIFQAAVGEARRRRAVRLERQGNRAYEAALENLRRAQDAVATFEGRSAEGAD